MNLTPKELTPCKISHICRCAFNDLGANNWDESKVEETMFIFRTNGTMNENFIILTANDANTLSSGDPSLLLFQESQFSTSNSTSTIIHSAVTSVTPTPQYKDDANHKHLKNQRTEQLSAELKLLECFNREELNVMKKRIEDLRSQKVIPNHSVVTKSLKEEL